MPKYFPALDDKKNLIDRIIVSILDAAQNPSVSSLPDDKLAFGQSNLGEYLGYLSEAREPFPCTSTALGEFNNLEGLEELNARREKTNFLVYNNRKQFVVKKSPFLLPEDIKEILEQSQATAEQLKDESLFKAFLSNLVKSYVDNPVKKNQYIDRVLYEIKASPEEAIDKIIFRQEEFGSKPESEGGEMERRRHEYKKCPNPVTVSNSPSVPQNQIVPQNKKTPAQSIFQDAVHDVFYRNGRAATSEERARLRDRFANAVLPKEELAYLNNSNQQLDTTEFLNSALDALLEDGKNKIEVESVLSKSSGNSHSKTQETKLDLPFVADEISCKAMFEKFCAEENLNEVGKKRLKPKVQKADSELVISLKRTDYKAGTAVKINNPVKLDDLEIETTAGGKQKYEATAFIRHIGSTPNSGHYATYIKEDDNQWYCYNDSSRTPVSGATLEKAKKEAYTVKYSPLKDGAVQGAARYKTGLPPSQKNGISNGGVRCWANAAFVFALSMNSLHDKSHVRVSEVPSAAQQKIESLTNEVLEVIYAENPNPLVLAKTLKRNVTDRAKLDTILQKIGAGSTSTLFGNEVERYLTKLAEKTEKKADEILGCYGFLSDEANIESSIKIFEEIEANQNNFLENPTVVLSQLIIGSEKNRAKALQPKPPEKPVILDVVAICHNAIEMNNKEMLELHLDNAKKQDKDFLTNALCHSVISEKNEISNFLKGRGADPKKASPLYDNKTAEEIEKERAPASGQVVKTAGKTSKNTGSSLIQSSVKDSNKSFSKPPSLTPLNVPESLEFSDDEDEEIPSLPVRQPNRSGSGSALGSRASSPNTPAIVVPVGHNLSTAPLPTSNVVVPKTTASEIYQPLNLGENIQIKENKVVVTAKVKDKKGQVVGTKEVEIKNNPLVEIIPANEETSAPAAVKIDQNKFREMAMQYYHGTKEGKQEGTKLADSDIKSKGENLGEALTVYRASPGVSPTPKSCSPVSPISPAKTK